MNNKKKMILLISAIAVCLIIAVLLAVFLPKHGKSNNTSPSSEITGLEKDISESSDSAKELPTASLSEDAHSASGIIPEDTSGRSDTSQNFEVSPSNLDPLPPSTETDIVILPKLPSTDSDLSVTP